MSKTTHRHRCLAPCALSINTNAAWPFSSRSWRKNLRQRSKGLVFHLEVCEMAKKNPVYMLDSQLPAVISIVPWRELTTVVSSWWSSEFHQKSDFYRCLAVLEPQRAGYYNGLNAQAEQAAGLPLQRRNRQKRLSSPKRSLSVRFWGLIERIL